MAKKGLNSTSIVHAAAALAEEKGLDNITLRELAESLGVKTASLYNHLNGLPELNARLAELAVERLDAALRDAAVGRSNREALFALANAYRRFAKEAPELYKAMMNLPHLEDSRLNESGHEVMRIFYRVLEPYQLPPEEKIHWGRSMRSALHGFVSLEEAGFFQKNTETDKSFCSMMENHIRILEIRAGELRDSREKGESH